MVCENKESISSTFYAHIFCRYLEAKKLQSKRFSFVIFGAKILYEKHAPKMLLKLTESKNMDSL